MSPAADPSRDAIALASGPVTWGVDFADTPTNPPWPLVLDEIAASGVGALELGPVGYLPEDGETLRAALEQRGLDAVGSFVFDDFHDPAAAEGILATTERVSRMVAAAGGSVVVLIDRVSDERGATVARSAAARRLDDGAWDAMIALLEAAAGIARRHGLRPTVHPHAGSFVEFGDELERLLASSTLDLCLDTGHLALAGVDPAAAIRAHGARLGHLHLKDVDGAVRADAVARRIGFWDALAARVFCPLGEGIVDLPAVAEALGAVGYRGYATLEQDRVPGTGTPAADLERSLIKLAQAGFAAPVR